MDYKEKMEDRNQKVGKVENNMQIQENPVSQAYNPPLMRS